MYWLGCNTINKKIILVICDDWHFKTIFPNQCNLSKITPNKFTCEWINVKKEFKRCGKIYKRESEISLNQMLEFYDINETSIDETNKIHRLLVKLCSNFTLNPTKIIS